MVRYTLSCYSSHLFSFAFPSYLFSPKLVDIHNVTDMATAREQVAAAYATLDSLALAVRKEKNGIV